MMASRVVQLKWQYRRPLGESSTRRRHRHFFKPARSGRIIDDENSETKRAAKAENDSYKGGDCREPEV